VQDLVQKVDNERSGRKRANGRSEDAPPPPAESAPPRQAGPTAARRTGTTPPRPPNAAQRRSSDAAPAQPSVATTRRAAPSSVVEDIATGGQPTASRPTTSRRGTPKDSRRSASGAPEPPEVVTDVIPPVTEPTRTKRRPATWPTTGSDKPETAAQPKSVGKPPLSRLAAGKQRRDQRLRLAGRVTLTMFAALALLVTGGGWSYLRSTANGFTQVNALGDHPEDVVDAVGQLGDETYLIVGTDTRAGANAQVGAGSTADAEGARSDTVMLVNIPKNRQRVVAVSFPRDLDVTRPQCAGWDNDKGTYTQDNFPSAMGDKLNAVYALGGPKCLVNVIRKMTGLNIGHFIGIDFAGFETMVDQVGGVEVCTTKPITDEILGDVLDSTGTQRINGATALNYVRARHVYGEQRSDYDRINRQQRFLASLLRGAMSSRVLFDPGKLNGFITAFTSHTFVDKVTPTDLLKLGRSLQNVDAGAVTFLTIPTAGTTSYGNEIPRESDIKSIFRAIIDDQPLPGEKKQTPAPSSSSTAPPAPPRVIAVDPSSVSLLVSNGSGTPGAASKVATKLSNQGFPIYNTGNYSGGTSSTSKIRYASGHEADAATVATAIPGATLEQASDLGGIIEVVLGGDFKGTVTAPTPVGDPITNVPISASMTAAPVTLPADLEHVNASDESCN
jgi:LCP family protein required for cell wall assembly